MNIKLYRDDGLKLYSTIDNTGVEIYFCSPTKFYLSRFKRFKKGLPYVHIQEAGF